MDYSLQCPPPPPVLTQYQQQLLGPPQGKHWNEAATAATHDIVDQGSEPRLTVLPRFVYVCAIGRLLETKYSIHYL